MTPGLTLLDLPSPTRLLLREENRELWLKDDGMVCADYGGNKPRKLLRLLEQARQAHAKRIVTIGVVGSHHVLATGILGRKLGLETVAISLPRPFSEHAEQTTRRSLLAGVELISALEPAQIPKLLVSLFHRDNYFIPPGGSNALGASSYLDALLELEQQVHQGLLPEPDLIFVALGSGGTAAGLLAGLVVSSLRSRLVAIPVLNQPAPRYWVEGLARRTLRLIGRKVPADLSARLEMDSRWIGKGYGFPTLAGETAIGVAAQCGLSLESTYTGKAFAAALGWLSGSGDRGNVSTRSCERQDTGDDRNVRDPPKRALFWSTIASTKEPLAYHSAVTLSPAIARLLRTRPNSKP